VTSPLFFAHIRAAIGSQVQQSNCHPFRHDGWLWMHNGLIREFATVKRDLVLAVDESLYPQITGQTDSEVLLYLALTFGLAQDPPGGVARAIGFAEECGHRHGVRYPFQGTIAVSDGRQVWGFRYSSEGQSRSLFVTRDVAGLRRLHPERKILQQVPDDARLVVSEPIGDLPGAWEELPEASYAVAGHGHHELLPFTVQPPARAR